MGKVRHYLNGVLLEEETVEEETEERIIFNHVEDYDLNHHFFTRTKVTVSSEEENEEEVLDKIEQEIMEPFKNEEELPEEWDILQKLFNVYYEFYGADPSYEATIKYIGGDFPRREITIKFF